MVNTIYCQDPFAHRLWLERITTFSYNAQQAHLMLAAYLGC
jgi:hypothetical protein